MKIKEGFIVKKIVDTYMVVSTASADFTKMQTMNETGAMLWETLQTDTDIDALVSKLLAEYDVDEATARRDAEEFVAKLREADLLDE